MTLEENKRRAKDPHVKYIKDHLCDKTGDKPFVFISYKSDDWEIVLQDVVYRLVKEYGLHVYFDGSFDSHNSLWIKQFPENMDSTNCKGILAFLDNKYSTSYATLLELMYSQERVDKYGKKNPLPVVPVNLEKMTAIEDEGDTGLGKNIFEDKSINQNASHEKALFDGILGEIKAIPFMVKNRYRVAGDVLSKQLCSTMVNAIITSLAVNENMYDRGESLDSIVGTIKDACGSDVFGPVKHEPNPDKEPDEKGTDKEKPDKGEPDKEESDKKEPDKGESDKGKTDRNRIPTEGLGRISLVNFLKEYDNYSFKKSTYAKFRLVGTAGYEKYGTEFFDSAYDLAWVFVMGLIKERGKAYIDSVNEKHPGLKNPVFLSQAEYENHSDQKKYKQVDAENVEPYYMYRHYGQYQWIDAVLKTRLLEFGLPLTAFYFEYAVAAADTDNIVIINPVVDTAEEPEIVDGTDSVDGTDPVGMFVYTLWGELHKANKLSSMMHDIFDLIAEKYPEMIKTMAGDDSITAVATKEAVDGKMLPDNKLNYFKAKKEHKAGNDLYYVSTRYNREQGIGQLKRMLIHCEGNDSALVIKAMPDKNKQGGNAAGGKSSGKKGIGEFL